ncbi:hypothetical protein MferCBS49748_006268 [Microsporum ferrugineum]
MADLSTFPIAPNPNGLPPNFVDPPSRESTVLVLGLTLICISTLCIMMRLFTNYKHMGKLCLDDYLCVFGEMAGIGFWAIIYNLARGGAATHTWDAPASLVTKSFIKQQFAQQMLTAPAQWATKAAVLALYIRIFNTVRWMRRTCYILIIVMLLVYGINIILAAVYCLPRNGAPWDNTAFTRCAEPVVLQLFIGSFSVLADLILFALPFAIIPNLHVARTKKIGLTCVFVVGLLTVAASITGLGYRVKLYLGGDPLWNGITLTLTTFAEVFGTVIVSCAPAIYAFWLKFIQEGELYSQLLSKMSLSRTRVKTDDSSTQGGQYDSSSDIKEDHHDWPDKPTNSYGRLGLLTRVYSTSSPSSTFVPMKNVIAKSTRIDQSSTPGK